MSHLHALIAGQTALCTVVEIMSADVDIHALPTVFSYRRGMLTGRMIFTWSFSVVCFCMATMSWSQSYPIFRATVVDEHNQPVPFASVRLLQNRTGVITNADGSFQIPAREIFKSDTLLLTCIGFKNRRIPVATLDPSGFNFIRMQSAPVQLSAVEIRSAKGRKLNARRIVGLALARIPYNYPDSSFGYSAYYRDYQVKDNAYINLHEAIVRIRDNGFSTNDQLDTKIQLMQYKVNTAFPVDTIATQPYDNRDRKFIPHASLRNFGGNELSTLRVHDPIRNHFMKSFSFIDRLDKDFMVNHRFSMAGQMEQEGDALYVIHFLTLDRISGMQHQGVGKIYIEKGNYRIHKLEYSTNEWVDHKPVPLYNITVEYTQRDNLMCLNYISFHNRFKMRNADDFRVVDMKQMTDSGAFQVRFSHQPAAKSALMPSNYDIRVNGKRIDVKKVYFKEDHYGEPGYHMDVILKVKSLTELNRSIQDMPDKAITIRYGDIFDLKGRRVNVMTYLDATQYREIFVLQLIDPREVTHYAEINKFVPLGIMSVPKQDSAFTDSWMNTPLKKELVVTPEVTND